MVGRDTSSLQERTGRPALRYLIDCDRSEGCGVWKSRGKINATEDDPISAFKTPTTEQQSPKPERKAIVCELS
jgi:hypothetical protein